MYKIGAPCEKVELAELVGKWHEAWLAAGEVLLGGSMVGATGLCDKDVASPRSAWACTALSRSLQSRETV